MAPKTKYVGEYKLGLSIGKGSFGTVRKATKTSTGETFAIKKIPAAKIDKGMLEEEIRNQQLLQHKHVVRIVDVLREDGDAYIVMELLPGGDLFDLIERDVRMPENKARRLFQQIIAGVEHCHVNKIAHRDLKPENIFLDKAHNIKIGDFGLSARMKGKLLTHACGTWTFAAPEMFAKDCQYEGPEVDIWSCGIILFELLCSELPFKAEEKSDLFLLIQQGQFVVPDYVSTEAKDLIKKMLTVNRSNRISLPDIKEHPWFKKDLPTDLFPRCAGAQYEELYEDVDESSVQSRRTSIDTEASAQSSHFNLHRQKALETRSTIDTETSRSTLSSHGNHHHLEKKSYFDGIWIADGEVVASISGASLFWADAGGVAAFTEDITGRKISMMWQGNECIAELKDGKLYWSDGDTWERKVSQRQSSQKLSMAHTMRKLINKEKMLY